MIKIELKYFKCSIYLKFTGELIKINTFKCINTIFITSLFIALLIYRYSTTIFSHDTNFSLVNKAHLKPVGRPRPTKKF